MEEWAKKIVAEEKRKRGIPLEPKLLNENYYLYHATTRYDKATGNSRKVSEYIGRINENGIIEAHHRKRSIYEYGNSQLVYSISSQLAEKLRKHFPETWESIYALSLIRFIDLVPLGSAKERWERLHISTFMNAHLSPNTLTDLLHQTGSDMASQYPFFQDLVLGSKSLHLTYHPYSPDRRTLTWHRRDTIRITHTFRRSTRHWC